MSIENRIRELEICKHGSIEAIRELRTRLDELSQKLDQLAEEVMPENVVDIKAGFTQ